MRWRRHHSRWTAPPIRIRSASRRIGWLSGLTKRWSFTHMSKVLLVGKGAPDRGGIPTLLDNLLRSRLAQEPNVRFLNVVNYGVPEGGRATPKTVRRTLFDTAAVWRSPR